MDATTLLQMGGVSTTGVAILLIVYRLLKTMRGKKFVSSCCGKKMDVGFDVADMSPSTSSSALQRPSETKPNECRAEVPVLASRAVAPVVSPAVKEEQGPLEVA